MEQKIKNYLGVAGIIGILLFGISAWRFVSSYADSISPGSYRSFSASADGTATVIPDVAKFTFSVLTEGGKDLSALQTKNAEKSEKAVAFLKGKDVEAKDIKTENYSLEPRYEYSNCGIYGSTVCPPPTIVGYTINSTFSVKVRDIANAGEILSGIVESGANNVSQLQFTLDNPDSAKNEARAEAMAKAQDKAKQIAKEGGFSVGKLISVSVSDSEAYPMYYGMGASDSLAKSAPSPTIEPGSKEVKVQVSLTYEIK